MSNNVAYPCSPLPVQPARMGQAFLEESAGGKAAMTQSENELFQVRLEKLERIRQRGIEPYPHNYERTHTSAQAEELFAQAEAEQPENARTESVSVAGRIVAFRGMGRASFADLLDGDGHVQVMFRRNSLPDTYEMLGRPRHRRLARRERPSLPYAHRADDSGGAGVHAAVQVAAIAAGEVARLAGCGNTLPTTIP